MPAFNLRSFVARVPRPVLLGGGLILLALLGLLALHFQPGPGGSETAPAVSVTRPTAVPASSSRPVSSAEALRQIKFVTSLRRDPQGRVWIGTEDTGLWRYDPAAPVTADYAHYRAADGPGDDTVYALACDKRGRVWVGTLNHGVSVFNGQTWGHYAPPDGLLGCRVFALAVNPVSGGVWIATEAGLTRYEQGRWTDYTHGSGLPTSNATALAFAPNGTLYVGTECDGIAVGSLRNDYKTWHLVPGPASLPGTLRGTGLPSGLINCLQVTRDGTAWAGTTAGLARSADGGYTWRFRRGADWKAKSLGGYAPGRSQISLPLKGPSRQTPGLNEDYVTCLADDSTGHLIIGHRQQPPEALDLKTGRSRTVGPNVDTAALLPLPAGDILAGNYGESLFPLAVKNTHSPAALPVSPVKLASAPEGTAPLPVSPPPPHLAQLNAMLAEVDRAAPDPQELRPHVAALADDWRTEGDWLGRYGRYWAALAAFFHPIPEDYLWGAGSEPIQYAVMIGPSHAPGDSLRYFLEWRYTDDPRVLEMPAAYTHSRVLRHYTTWAQDRREAEWDDHGEVYPLSMAGPNVYATLTVPNGLYYLSLYDFNKNGHDNGGRVRDYRLSVRVHAGPTLEETRGFEAQPELAHGRIHSFWHGVWKRFLVRGPLSLTVEVNRNYSANTILPAVMLDSVDEDPTPYFHTRDQWNAREAERERLRVALTKHPHGFSPAATEADAAGRLLDALNEKRLTNSVWWAVEGRRYYAPLLRWYRNASQQPAAGFQSRFDRPLATCEYQIGRFPLWEKWQHKAGLTTARQIETSLRWDGVTNSYSGLGYQIVSAHQSEMTGRKLSQSR